MVLYQVELFAQVGMAGLTPTLRLTRKASP